MSDYETIKGTLKPIIEGTPEEIEAYAKERMGGENKSTYFDNYTEWFLDEHYKQYVIIKNVVYEITDEQELSIGDIFESAKQPDGTIQFVVQYYNGACSLSEALEEATK